jgi:hypothetical protein
MAAKPRLMIGGAAVESLTDWVARHSFKHRPTIAFALAAYFGAYQVTKRMIDDLEPS